MVRLTVGKYYLLDEKFLNALSYRPTGNLVRLTGTSGLSAVFSAEGKQWSVNITNFQKNVVVRSTKTSSTRVIKPVVVVKPVVVEPVVVEPVVVEPVVVEPDPYDPYNDFDLDNPYGDDGY